MDRMPGAGGPPGSGVDGAFERFLTAAIATIITIMFSWRLLAEEEEAAARGEGASAFKPAPVQYKQISSGYGRFDPPLSNQSSPNAPGLSDFDLSDIEESARSSSPASVDIIEKVISERYEPQSQAVLTSAPSSNDGGNLSDLSQADDSGDQETLTTWDEYKWEEELGQEKEFVIKTRRTVRDFAKPQTFQLQSPPIENINGTDMASIDAVANANSEELSSSAKSPVVPFTQRFANFEYKDTGGDSGYVDLYPDSDTSDSSDDENVYEIQVSDSDSDSEGDRGGSFFGVTSLDTIMEEYESDYSDICEKGEDRLGENSAESIIKSGVIDRACSDCGNSGDNDTAENSTNRQIVLEKLTLNTEGTQSCEMTKNEDYACIPEQNATVTESSEADRAVCNLSPEITCKAESTPLTQLAGPAMLREFDFAVNNTYPVNKPNIDSGENYNHSTTADGLNETQQVRKSDYKNISEDAECKFLRESAYDTNSVPDELKLPQAKQTETQRNLSKICDDRSPSPVRTNAIDDIGADSLSDTESCSSESVITVLSVRSNDSDSYSGDRYDVTGNGQSGHRQLMSAGNTDQSLNINDLRNDGSGSYENNSLVSGFLNDSLNSLLSANNDDTDTESGDGLDEEHRHNVDTDTIKDTPTHTIENKNGIVDNNFPYSTAPVDTSNSNIERNESVLEPETIRREALRSECDGTDFIQSEISGTTDLCNQLNISERLSSEHICAENQLNLENETNYSDNSSDSSDPPLREYDPDDDDLAAFQFNQDSDCDNDSFYLLVGNEGSLRNFDTFTNLNSLGLSPEYGDAVTSHTVSDDARGFKFSYTEEINTDYSERSYFTDRSIYSDSDARSNDPLSPITSEDEEMVATENDKNEKFLIVDSNESFKPPSAYDDAELSTPVADDTDSNTNQSDAKRAIDFQKYIIQPEPAQQSELIPTGDKIRSQNDHKDVYEIDKDSGSNRSKIDRTGVISDSLGVTGMNNKGVECEEAETFSSLTDKIRSLSVVSDSSDSSHSEKENQSKENLSTFNNNERHLKDESATNSNIGTESKYGENSETPSVHGINQSSKSKETNIDDIFLDTKSDDIDTVVLEIKCSSGKVTDIDNDVLTKSVQTKNSVPCRVTSDVKASPNGAKLETAIDEVFDKDTSVRTESKPRSVTHLRPTGSKTETNIDDIFDDTNTQSASNSRANSNIETDVDDIVSEIPTSEEKLSYETFVDDLFQPIVPSSVIHEQSVPKDVTSESAIPRPKIHTIDQTESAAASGDVITKPNTLENRSSFVRSDEQVLNQQSKPNGISQSNRPAVYAQDNSGPKDKTSVIVDKISNIPRVENSSYLNIKLSNNERKRKDIIENTNNSQLLPSDVESHLNRDTQNVSGHGQSESVTKQQNFNNDTNNNSEFGLHPDINNSDNYTQDYIPLTHAASSGKLPDDIGDTFEVQGIVSTGDIELKIYEDEPSQKSENDNSDHLDSLSSAGSSSFVSDDESFSSVDENLLYQYAKLRARGLSESSISRVVRSPLTKPSDLFGRSKDLGQGVKRKVHKHQLKKYTSILQQPITSGKGQSISLTTPERPPSTSRLKVLQSRQRFLSAENLTRESFEDKFLQHRISLVSSTPRKYLKRHERHIAELQSTESLPTDMSHIAMLNASYDSYTGIDRMRSLPSPRNIEELYGSRYSSANSSFEKPDHHKLHANCIFSPEKREEIQHTTQSLENMFEQLLRYGSISSVAETDLDASVDASQPQSLPDTDFSQYVSFQYPLERAASMSAITGSSDGERLPRKPGKGRFAKRNVPKSKSLQTLETNLDDVFADEQELHGELKKVPSVHELRVSKSLSKLNVPDWFSRSTFSRSDSTQSLFTYAGRLGSTSTLGSYAYPPSLASSPAPTPGSQTVIIQKRVTPTSTIPSSAKLLRAPALPTTPEKAPIHPTTTGLPSDKFRKADRKELRPISIVPFAKIRAMFEQKSLAKPSTVSPVTSPTKEKAKVRFEPVSPTRDSNATGFSSCRETDIDSRLNELEPVQNRTTSKSPPPPLPERKPILADSARRSEGVPQPNAQPRRTQVHFSDEPNVSKSQEQNSNVVQQNGTSSKPKSTIKKQGLRASLPLPQFRFRRPGPFATKAATEAPAPQPQVSQNKKGKVNGFDDKQTFRDLVACESRAPVTYPPWLHVVELNAKTDGETLFEFLQKRRYSSIIENGFAEQLQELNDQDVGSNFPVLTLGTHSNGLKPVDGAPDLRVVHTDAYSHRLQNDFLNKKLRGESSVDDILDGLLLLDGYRTGRMKMDENGRIVPKLPGDGPYSPDTPPGYVLNHNTTMCKNNYDVLCVENDVNVDYVLVKCEFPHCHRETNLREAKKSYKMCHSCYTYYCTRACRKNDWDSHKKLCIYSRINSACKHVIKCTNRLPQLQYHCSRVARRGYLSQGRGCVIFAFPDIGSAEDFLQFGMGSLWVPPVYIALKELPNAKMLGSKLEILTETCKQYNPELKYVIHVAIVIPPQLPTRPVPRRVDGIIQKCAKLRLSPAHMHPKQDNDEIPSTLILTAVPGNQHSDEQDGRKTRELCFINIQRKLRYRGVSLRHQFSEVYNKLIEFVADAKHFSPLIIYPTDGRTGRKFMCVIMPEAEPEIEWISDPDLFRELDVFDDEEEDISTPNLSLCYQETPEEIML